MIAKELIDPLIDLHLQKLRLAAPDFNFQLFGSHLTGLAHEKSDIDFLVADAIDSGCPKLGAALEMIGYKRVVDHGYVVPGKEGKPYELKSIEADKNLVVFRLEGDPKVDVIVVRSDEFERRLRTLKILGLLVQHAADPEKADARKFGLALKGQHVHWRTLHRMIEMAYYDGYNDANDADVPF